MKYQKIINLLDKTPNQPNIFRTKKTKQMIIHMERITLIVKLNL